MSVGRGKKSNEYARLAYGVDAPKTVFMALAVAFAMRAGETGLIREDVERALMAEWQALHDNGIVPQKPRLG